jgi:hypothetical protein
MLLMGPMGDLDTTHSACQGLAVDPVTKRDNFFPERGTAQITARDAKAVCNGGNGVPECPIREQCLEYALARKERFGIWGGRSERERARIAKQRRVEQERRELEAKQAAELTRQRRSEGAKRAWEKRRRLALEQQEHAAIAATRSKETSGQGTAKRGRRVAA